MVLVRRNFSMLQNNNKENNLKIPFFEILNSLGFSHFDNFHYFATGTLFWSLTRLFLQYQRIIYPIYTKQTIIRDFSESDIESYIIRQRIILDDIAFIIWQLLPKESCGLKNPNGPIHLHYFNRRMSINNIIKYVEKNQTEFKRLYEVLEKNKNWIIEMRDQRDGIVHFKSKVLLFETKPDISFAIIDAAGAKKTEPTDNGGERVVTTPIFEFINTQTKSLMEFLNTDLKRWLEDYIKDKNMTYRKIGGDTEITCIGIPLFKEINKIK